MKILFVCRANVARSQMAEEFFNGMSKKNKAVSAGVEVKERGKMIGEISPVCVESMLEEGINIERKKPRQIKFKEVKNADVVVLITKEGEIPDYVNKAKRLIFWDIDDPKDENLNVFRRVRDRIKREVIKLVRGIG